MQFVFLLLDSLSALVLHIVSALKRRETSLLQWQQDNVRGVVRDVCVCVGGGLLIDLFH